MDNLEFSRKLEKRLADFADRTLILCRKLDKDSISIVIIKQLVRSSGSVGANYIEANESLSRKDFFHRIRISRKEAKESRFWLERLLKLNPTFVMEIDLLIQESTELVLLFSKIVSKS